MVLRDSACSVSNCDPVGGSGHDGLVVAKTHNAAMVYGILEWCELWRRTTDPRLNKEGSPYRGFA